MTTRRNILKTAPAVLAAALPAFALAGAEEDHELQRLWSEYLSRFRAYRDVQVAYIPARDAYDADLPPCPKSVLPGAHMRDHRPLWLKHDLDRLGDAMNEAARSVHETVEAIRETDASTIIGLGIKLAALATPVGFMDDFEDSDDAIEAHRVTLDNIARLTGRTDFAVPAVPRPFEDTA